MVTGGLQTEAFQDDCVVDRVQGNRGSLLVWDGFSLFAKLDLYISDECVTGVAYRNNILLGKVIPHIKGHPAQNLVFQEDNAHAHHARVCNAALSQGLNGHHILQI